MKILSGLGHFFHRKGAETKLNGRFLHTSVGASKTESAWTEAEETVISERYKLHRIIGEGGYGRVWLAEQPDGKRVALKIVIGGDGRANAFEAECQAIERFKRLSHDCESLISIDRVEDHSQNGFIFYTMPLADAADGGQCVAPEHYKPKTLAHELKTLGHLPVKECITIATRVLEALKVLHENNYMHGDVKPSNVIYLNGSPVLADIGLVAPEGDNSVQAGTRAYMAPDPARTYLSDLYSVGILLYHMATGNLADRFPSVKRQIKDPLFKGLRHVYEIAGNEDFRKRYVSAGAMIRALANVPKDIYNDFPFKGDEFAELMKGASAAQLSKYPDPPEMRRFKSYIGDFIEEQKRGVAKCSKNYGTFVTPEDFSLITQSVRLEFERRIGFAPRNILAVCLFSEALIMGKNRDVSSMYTEEIYKSLTDGETFKLFLIGTIYAFGWETSSFLKLLQTVTAPPAMVLSKLIPKRMLRFVWISYIKNIIGRTTPAERTDRVFQALSRSVNKSITEIWPEYGKYLRV
jgi:serine/threonine protein kinase